VKAPVEGKSESQPEVDEEPIHFRKLLRTASKSESGHKKASWTSRLKDDTTGVVSSAQLKDIVPGIQNIMENLQEKDEAIAIGHVHSDEDEEVHDKLEVIEEEMACDESESAVKEARTAATPRFKNGHKNGDVELPKPIMGPVVDDDKKSLAPNMTR
jgi:hypothetical protein